MTWTGPFDSLVGWVDGDSSPPVRIRAAATSTVEIAADSDARDAPVVYLTAPPPADGFRRAAAFTGVPAKERFFRAGQADPPRVKGSSSGGSSIVGPAPGLRMYHVAYEPIREAVDVDELTMGGGTYEDREDFIAYIDSDTNGDFLVDPEGYFIFWLTAVPALRQGYFETEFVTSYDFYDYTIDGVTSTFAVVNTSQTVMQPVYALYKDPHVLAVPEALGGGWLMLLARVVVDYELVLEQALAAGIDPDRAARDLVSRGPGNLIGDIVAFWSPSQTFSEANLAGPYLVVDSLRGVGTHEVTTRMWLGAPTGAFRLGSKGEWEFHVYFNAELPVSRSGESYEEDVDGAEVRELFSIAAGIGHVRIEGSVVEDALVAGPPEQEYWTADDAWAERPAGQTLNLVRTWMADASGTVVARPLRDAIEEAVDAHSTRKPEVSLVSPGYGDPAVVTVLGGGLVLLLGVGLTDYTRTEVSNEELTSDGNTLFGLWRLASVDDGVPLPDGRLAEFGLDFIASYGTDDSPDLVAPSYSVGAFPEFVSNHQYVDPDPVEFDGEWRVYTREEYPESETVTTDEHEYYTASHADFADPVLS